MRKPRARLSHVIVGCLVIAGLVALSSAAFAFLTMVAWNLIVPAVFHGPAIDIWQALGLNFLLSMVGYLIRK